MMEHDSGCQVDVQRNGVSVLGNVDEFVANRLLPVVQTLPFISHDKSRGPRERLLVDGTGLGHDFNSQDPGILLSDEIDRFIEG